MPEAISIIIIVSILALLPFVLIMMTSFVKLVVVFSILRTAIGFQQIPPNQVITGISIILTVFIMMPVGEEIHEKLNNSETGSIESILRFKSVKEFSSFIEICREPVCSFLSRHAHESEKRYYVELRNRMISGDDATPTDENELWILIPAFMLSELKEAFLIGFILFLPFIIIDMVVANILQAMGMVMLSPTTISLPFKLLLFVMVDGWYLITRGLVESYMR